MTDANIKPMKVVNATYSATAGVTLPGQHDKADETRAMLLSYCNGNITAHELIVWVHAETGFQVQRLERDAMRLVHIHETPLADIATEIVISL